MLRYRSGNPVVRRVANDAQGVATADQASYAGVISKTAWLLALMVFSATLSGSTLLNQTDIPSFAIFGIIAAPIIGFISLLIAMFVPKTAPFFGSLYAVAQGSFIGVISMSYEIVFGDGIVAAALTATIGVFVAMLVLYATGLVTVGSFMRRALMLGLFGILISSLILWPLSIFGVFGPETTLNFIFAITVIAVIVASLFLLVDFDNIRNAVDAGADKRYEWLLSLGLVVTLVWLYIELLRLIAILRSRRR